MDFENRLKKAIERGNQTRDREGEVLAEQAMTEEQLRNVHSRARLELSEHIEDCLRKLCDHFPGFQFETVVGENGWGGKLVRDDITLGANKRPANLYSRVEMLIRPFSDAHILAITAKATIRNKEVFHRDHYQMLSQIDQDSFAELIDLWVLEYAEQFAART